MTEDPVIKIIEQAFSDEGFRRRLLGDIQGTLKELGQRLSPEQVRQLREVLEEKGESFASGLDQRLSQSGVSLSPQGLLRRKSKTDDREAGPARRTETTPKRKQPARQTESSEGSMARPLSVSRPDDGIDGQEPDYEVETD
jgi:hypothetical protein